MKSLWQGMNIEQHLKIIHSILAHFFRDKTQYHKNNLGGATVVYLMTVNRQTPSRTNRYFTVTFSQCSEGQRWPSNIWDLTLQAVLPLQKRPHTWWGLFSQAASLCAERSHSWAGIAGHPVSLGASVTQEHPEWHPGTSTEAGLSLLLSKYTNYCALYSSKQ